MSTTRAAKQRSRTVASDFLLTEETAWDLYLDMTRSLWREAGKCGLSDVDADCLAHGVLDRWMEDRKWKGFTRTQAARWLIRGVRNRASTHLIASQRLLRTSYRPEDVEWATPESEFMGREFEEHLNAAIALLPSRQQAIFRLVHLEGLSPKCVAAKLGLSNKPKGLSSLRSARARVGAELKRRGLCPRDIPRRVIFSQCR